MVTIQSRAVSDKNRTTFTTGHKNVTSAGTGEALVGSSTPVPDGYQVVIKAKHGNGGIIYIGNSKTNSETTTTAFWLYADQSITLQISNLNLVWVNSSVNGEGVEYVFEA